MDLTIANKVKLKDFTNPSQLYQWAAKKKILENNLVKSRLLELKLTNQSDTTLTRNEQFELSLLPNVHLV